MPINMVVLIPTSRETGQFKKFIVILARNNPHAEIYVSTTRDFRSRF